MLVQITGALKLRKDACILTLWEVFREAVIRYTYTVLTVKL